MKEFLYRVTIMNHGRADYFWSVESIDEEHAKKAVVALDGCRLEDIRKVEKIREVA
jgi:hypothetical protein